MLNVFQVKTKASEHFRRHSSVSTINFEHEAY